MGPRSLLRPLVHHAGHLPAVIRRRRDQAILAAHGHRPVGAVGGAGGVVASDRCQPFDGSRRFAFGRLTLSHHHRLGAGPDSHHSGRVPGLRCKKRERHREGVRRRQE